MRSALTGPLLAMTVATLGTSALADATCCLPSENGKPGRCLERLSRKVSPDVRQAVCATQAANRGVSEFFSEPYLNCNQRNSLGITTPEFARNGWAQDGAKNGTPAWTRKHATDLAIDTRSCRGRYADWRWTDALEKCRKTGFEPVHLYLSLTDDFKDDMEKLVKSDSWSKSSLLEDSVVHIESTSLKGAQKALRKLAEECKVVDYVFVMAHGAPDTIAIGDSAVSFSDFFKDVLSPCYLSPNAQVQFASCNVACRESAPIAKTAIETHFRSVGKLRGGKDPFQNVRLLMNTSYGYMSKQGRFFGRDLNIRSENDLAIIYSVKGRAVSTDIPLSAAPACPRSE